MKWQKLNITTTDWSNDGKREMIRIDTKTTTKMEYKKNCKSKTIDQQSSKVKNQDSDRRSTQLLSD